MEAKRLYNTTRLSLMGYNPTPQSNQNRCPQFRENFPAADGNNNGGGVRMRALQGLRELTFIYPELKLEATDIIMNSEKESNQR